MKEKFTPGEWEITHDNCSAGETVTVNGASFFNSWNDSKTAEQNEIDAHLIAAAPKMYRMLEGSIDALRASSACGEDFPDEVLLLLAKARGE